MRALAVRILRRHGQEYADKILPLADDADSARCGREVLLALRTIDGDAALAALAQIAATYDGSDRYLLEAINIATAGRKAQLYAALRDAGQMGLPNLQLLRLLNPDAAAALLVQSMSDKTADDAARAYLLRELGGTPSIDAGRAVLREAADASAAPNCAARRWPCCRRTWAATGKRSAATKRCPRVLRKCSPSPTGNLPPWKWPAVRTSVNSGRRR